MLDASGAQHRGDPNEGNLRPNAQPTLCPLTTASVLPIPAKSDPDFLPESIEGFWLLRYCRGAMIQEVGGAADRDLLRFAARQPGGPSVASGARRQ